MLLSSARMNFSSAPLAPPLVTYFDNSPCTCIFSLFFPDHRVLLILQSLESQSAYIPLPSPISMILRHSPWLTMFLMCSTYFYAVHICTSVIHTCLLTLSYHRARTHTRTCTRLSTLDWLLISSVHFLARRPECAAL